LLDRNLILYGLPAGLLMGVAVWMLAGRGGASSEALQSAADALQAMHPPPNVKSSTALAPSFAAPLFAPPEPGAASTEISVALQGLTRSARRQAALLAIGGRPADWLSVGETRDAVTLESVRANSVTISTPAGSREISFGPAAPVAAPSSYDAGPPPGMRGPPPPASAPGVP